ncbi:tetratricopeptide repeat protein, partial [Spirulina sp. 06S082]|uniref:tetratricopeptide repeat protein n=1 Tax=Spirulina sp. 06S082 TaxID=3110248 RepID=UPI002B1FB912
MESTQKLTDPEEFIKCNQEPFQELLSFIDFAEADKFTLGFIEVNFSSEVDILLNHLKQHFQDEEVQIEVFRFPDPSLRFLRDALKEEIPKRNISSHKKTVLVIRDLEYAIGVYGNYPPFLQDLNFVRDAYKIYVRYPVLFVLPDFAMTRVTRFAPDFWDWRSGIFRFKTTQETRDFVENQTLKFDGYISSLNIPEKQEKIDNYHRLLMEYRPTGQQMKEEDIVKYSDILYKLGAINESQGNYTKARQYLEDSLEFATRKEDLSLKAGIINLLGWCDYKQGNYQLAMISCQQSLTIAREIQNRGEESNSLDNIGNVYDSQGEYSQAIKYHQQSLQIRREIGDRSGIAASLNNIGNIYQSQGEYGQAIKYHQQSLQIRREIGDRSGIASSLNNIGNIYQSQGEYSQAIKYHQQSLQIRREIGDRSGIAASLNNIG